VLGAGLGESNAFWVSPALERCLRGLDWNAGGQRTWLAPELGPQGFFGARESDWAVPPALDPGAYRLEQASSSSAACRGVCHLVSADGTEYALEIERRVEVCDLTEGRSPAAPGGPPGGRPAEKASRGLLLRLRHSLRNLGAQPIPARAGLWAILQLPAQPQGSLQLLDASYRAIFGELPADWVRLGAGGPQLRTAPGRRWKVGLGPSGPEARLTHRRREAGSEVQVELRCPTDPAGRYLDGGDALQVYNSPLSGGEAFCELECHAPAIDLAPGAVDGQAVEIEVSYET
jgi:hypothetical protein